MEFWISCGERMSETHEKRVVIVCVKREIRWGGCIGDWTLMSE